MKLDDLDRLVQAAGERRAALLVTDLSSHRQYLCYPDDLSLPAPLVETARFVFASGESGTRTIDGKEYFFLLRRPSPRLFLIGAVHIAQSLAPMARMAGYDCLIIDPRRAFATNARFPDTKLLHEWPDEALANIGLDADSALVTLTHDPKLDDPALSTALDSPVFYIGALGSKKTHQARLERLHGKTGLERIHGPVGMAIGARHPAEIAVAILAQIIAARRGPL